MARDRRFKSFWAEVIKIDEDIIRDLVHDGVKVVRVYDTWVIPNVNKYSNEARELEGIGFRESSLEMYGDDEY